MHRDERHGDHDPEGARLGAELEAALVRELHRAYQEANAAWFKKKLTPASILLSRGASKLGEWRPDERVIAIDREMVIAQPWTVVVEVLKHEMAHQYVHEVLGRRDETAHGPSFRDVCSKLGIDARASGMPRSNDATEGEAKVLERIARLLALADSPNQNEAQAAMSAAQRLMLKHNIEASSARAPRGYSFRALGAPVKRTSEPLRILGGIIAKHFFVEVIWVPIYLAREGRRATQLEACGTPANLEMAAYVHAFLTHTAEQLWTQHKRTSESVRGRDRVTFLSGVMLGFLEKLDAERAVTKSEGLVWVKDADLGDYYRKRHPHIQHVRHSGARRTAAHAEGRAQGRRIVLRKPVSEGPSGGPKLLGR